MHRKISFCILISTIIFLVMCSNKNEKADLLTDLPNNAQAISLLGDTLKIPEITVEMKQKFTQNLEQAKKDYQNNPDNADAIIWYGRRTAYLGDYRAAIKIFTEGINKHPQDARMYRHRGHRLISIREFDKAIIDFNHAVELIKNTKDEIEPDGLPNSRNIPVSTLHFNIWYHLGLAHYLKGELELALNAYNECMKVSKNADSLVATAHWLYMTLRRLCKNEEAKKVLEPIHAEMDIIESFGYHKLLLFYKSNLTQKELLGGSFDWINSPAVRYGVGNWHYYNGNSDEAKNMFNQIIKQDNWATFGYIAAEADLSRM